MASIGTNILAFVFVLGVMIFVHELGHFAMAKAFRIRVEVFALGFGPRLFGFRRGPTDYRVCALPLGGYVKMKGENPDDPLSGDPDEYLSRPKWQRFFVLVMGPAMNIGLALALLTVVYVAGIEVAAWTDDPVRVGWIEPGSPAAEVDLAPGDLILAVNGEPAETWRQFELEVLTSAGQALRLSVSRDGSSREVAVTPTSVTPSEVGYLGVLPPLDPLAGSILPDGPAARAGIQTGDRIVAVEGEPVGHFFEVTEIIRRRAGQPTRLTLERQGRQLTLTVTPEERAEDGSGYIGVLASQPVEVRRYGPVAAVGQALAEAKRQTLLVGEILGKLFTGRMSMKTLSGPIEIARYSGGAARSGDPSVLMAFMAVVSLQLGLLNLLPIPVLDGGHIAILLFEGLIRRDLSLRAKERILQLGFVLLVTLMLVVITFDVIKSLPPGWREHWPF